MPWMIVIVAIALWVGISKGVPALARTWGKRRQERRELKAFISQQRTKKKQLIAEAIKNGEAPAAAKAAAEAAIKAGEGLGVSVTTLGAVWGAFRDAFRTGWRQGRQQGHELRDRKRPQPAADLAPPSADTPATEVPPIGINDYDDDDYDDDYDDAGGDELGPPEPKPSVTTAEVDALVQSLLGQDYCIERVKEGVRVPGGYSTPPEFCCAEVAPDSYYCPQHQPASLTDTNPPAAPAPTPTGGSSMAIETRTSGEVLTREQFVAEMDTVIAEATGELEDAQGDLQRAQEDIQRVETMSASMASAEVDRATVEAVRELVDTNAVRRQLAQQRISAAENRKAKAEAAKATLEASAQRKFHAA